MQPREHRSLCVCDAVQSSLRRLWEAGFPGEEMPAGVRSPKWKEMGWQVPAPPAAAAAGCCYSLESLGCC